MSTYWHVDDEIWDDGAPDAVPIPAATAVELLNDMERSLGEATDRENRLKERLRVSQDETRIIGAQLTDAKRQLAAMRADEKGG